MSSSQNQIQNQSHSNELVTSARFASPEQFGVAIVGCGYWGPNQIRSFQSFQTCKVTAVDLDTSRLERLTQSFPGLATETNYQRLLDNAAINAVVIATPTATHHGLAKQALLAGKHVLCEKPLCIKTDDARELVELARSRDLTLMTGHTFLFNPGIVRLKQLIEMRELGDVLSLSSVRTNLGPIRSDVNAALDLAAHDVAIFNWLLESEPVRVSAIGGDFVQPGIHDVVFINLVYANQTVASIHASWLNPKKVRQMTVVGNRRMVTWDDLEMNTPIAIYDRGANVTSTSGSYGEFMRVSMWDGDVRLPKVEAAEPLKVQSRYFLDAIRDRSLRRSDGPFSHGVVRALEAINQSLAAKGAPIVLEPADLGTSSLKATAV